MIQTIAMSERQFPRTWDAVQEAHREKVAPGFVVGVFDVRHPRQAWVLSHGQKIIVPTSEPVSVETVFDLASVSKIYATAMLTAVLVERRWLDWNQPLKDFLPEFKDERVRIRHLLSHTAGFAAWLPLWEKLRSQGGEMRELVCQVPVDVAPGTRTVYSDIGFILLGMALQECAGLPLDQAVTRWVWKPMGIQNSFYRRAGADLPVPVSSIAATDVLEFRGGTIRGEVEDENCWMMGGVAGHAGVFAPVKDLMIWAQQLLCQKFPGQQTLRQAWTRVAEPSGCERTLGWDTPSGENASCGKYFSRRSVGHLGFSGTSFWLDPDAGLAVALLTNRVHPTRENIAIRAFRPRFHDALWLDLKSQ